MFSWSAPQKLRFCPKPAAVIWYVLLFVGFCFSPGKAFAYFAWTENTHQAYQAILELKIEKGRNLLKAEKAQAPDNSLVILLENYADFFTILLTDNTELYKAWAERESERLSLLEDEDEESPWFLYAQAEVKLQWALLKLKSGRELSGAWNLRRAYGMFANNDDKFPNFDPNRKSFGFLLMVLGLVPEQYAGIMHFIGLNGNTHLGLQKIQAACNSNQPVAMEAQWVHNLAQLYILHNSEQALKNMQSLQEKYPASLLLVFFQTDMLLRDAQCEKALKLLSAKPTGSEYLTIPFFNHQYADIYLQRGDYEEAIKYYQLFQKQAEGSNSKKDTEYKLFLCYYLLGRKPEALAHFYKITSTGSARNEPDRYAQLFADDANPNPEPTLMKARLLTDGGYYKQASQLMLSVKESSFPNLKDKIEFIYRQARIADKMHDTNSAITAYTRTISMGEGQKFYFSPNAALQLGYIYRNRKENARAIEAFKKVLTFSSYPYKSGIEGKAKAALHELGAK